MKRKITITMKSSRRLTTFCLTGALALGASGGALAAGNDAALQALFAQANYWHEKSHDELAMESLQKVLSVDANNTQALYLMALWSQQGGDMQAAAQWRARLAKAAPDSPGLQDLDNAKKMSQVPQGQLSLARQQARGGNIPGALATWRSMFNGNTPPAGLAAEYYLTMASDKSLYPQAISELRQYVAQHPQENAPRVALGKALTWREDTRREGIALLEPMASGNKEADSGLRQALLWLGPQAGDEQYYDTWMQRHPQDSEVQNYFRERRSGQARGQGYANLNSGNTAAAKQQFEEVLQTNPQDADALAGMGYIAQRSGDYQAASQYLSRAADLGGDASATRRQQAADALFYGQLAQAQQAYKQGNISQALALSAPLAQQSGARGASAKLFRADVLRHNKDLPQAEQTLRSLLNDDPQNAAARENLYYVLREQNKSAEAQAMLQTPAGWFDLLIIMVEGMLNNAGELESQPFLRQMGASLAETHPLPASETVGELEANINRLLTHFHWGVVTIDVGEDGLRLRHQALPVSRDDAGRVRWCNAFCAILEGLYSRWLQSQGGSAHVILQRERVFSVSDVQFLYYHP